MPYIMGQTSTEPDEWGLWHLPHGGPLVGPLPGFRVQGCPTSWSPLPGYPDSLFINENTLFTGVSRSEGTGEMLPCISPVAAWARLGKGHDRPVLLAIPQGLGDDDRAELGVRPGEELYGIFLYGAGTARDGIKLQVTSAVPPQFPSCPANVQQALRHCRQHWSSLGYRITDVPPPAV